MARLHSSLGDRTVYTAAGLAKAQGFAARVYEDPAGTILASLAVYDPTNAAVPGAVIPGAALVVDAFSNRPAFWDLNDRDVLYITVAGGPLEPIRPDAQPQVTALATRVGTVEGVAAAAETPTGAQAKANAAQSAAIAAAAADATGKANAAQAASAQKASNLADLANAPTARTNLGLGGASTLNVGTAAGTVAAGDDTRITGAAQKANNLADLASASSARTNLGLGGAAVLPVGTTPGTVAAGDDSRITGARGSFGYPATLDPIVVRGTDSAALGAGECWYLRVSDGGVISKIGLEIVTSSGNISVAAYRNGGTGLAAVPATRLATSGAVACPTAGYAEISLGATITVNPGDWLSLSSDNGTAAFRCMLGGVLTSQLAAGRIYMQTSAHPAPSPPGALAARLGRNILLIGVA